MPNSFQKVNQSLRIDHGAAPLLIMLVAMVLIASWLLWAFKARLTRYEVSDSARLEVTGAASVLQAGLAGEVQDSYLVLGRTVAPGDILLQLDDTSQRLALNEERTRRQGLNPELQALKDKLQSQLAGKAGDQRVLTVASEAAQAQFRDAQAQALLAAQEEARTNKLRAAGLIAEAEAERARAAAASKKATAESLQLAAQRLAPELALRNTDRATQQDQILSDIAKLQADMAASEAEIRRLAYEVERRKIRAPLAGKLTECETLRAGTHLSEGQRLGVILPPGSVEVIADFAPASALGKIRPGQHAVVRLNGFPWAHFGLLQARVSRVAGDIRDGKVRVELALNKQPSAIPLQHGLPGSVEVEVERISPAGLLMRSAGQVAGAR
jgi:membrane fusion protein (multidrug efflux system)